MFWSCSGDYMVRLGKYLLLRWRSIRQVAVILSLGDHTAAPTHPFDWLSPKEPESASLCFPTSHLPHIRSRLSLSPTPFWSLCSGCLLPTFLFPLCRERSAAFCSGQGSLRAHVGWLSFSRAQNILKIFVILHQLEDIIHCLLNQSPPAARGFQRPFVG